MAATRSKRRKEVLGTVLVALGAVFLVDELFDVNVLRTLWPVGLIALGAYLIWGAREEADEEGRH